MIRTFRPLRSVVVAICAGSYGIAFFVLLILIFSGNTLQSLVYPTAVLFILGSIFPVLFFSRKIIVEKDQITFFIFPFLKKEFNISSITKISSINKYVGFGQGKEIHYLDNLNKSRSVRIGLAFGEKQIQTIVDLIENSA